MDIKHPVVFSTLTGLFKNTKIKLYFMKVKNWMKIFLILILFANFIGAIILSNLHSALGWFCALVGYGTMYLLEPVNNIKNKPTQ